MRAYKTHDGIMNNIESILDWEGVKWKDYCDSREYMEMSGAILSFFLAVENDNLTGEYEDD